MLDHSTTWARRHASPKVPADDHTDQTSPARDQAHPFPPSMLALSSETTSAITWSRWDTLGAKRLLMVGKASSVHVWDVTDLEAVHEVSRLVGIFGNSEPRTAIVLPSPPTSVRDAFVQYRPLMSVLLSTGDVILCSLSTRQIVHRVSVFRSPGAASPACDMQASSHFVVVAAMVSSISVNGLLNSYGALLRLPEKRPRSIFCQLTI